MSSPEQAAVAAANADQVERWDGAGGDRWVADARYFERSGAPHAQRLLEAARIEPGERVLDFGCGAGRSSLAAAEAARPGAVLGVDLSAAMLALARRRAGERGVHNADFVQTDAQVHSFEPGSFDLAISSFGSMFFADPRAAFANIGSALRGGGRLALITWRGLADNEWILNTRRSLAAGRDLPPPVPDEPGMFGLSEAATIERRLAAAGFAGIEIEPVDLPVVLGDDADDAAGFVTRSPLGATLLEDLEGACRQDALERLHASLAARETSDGVVLGSGAWLTTARRV